MAQAQDSAEFAKKLSKPVAAMISVPFQFNYDSEFGPARDRERLLMNIQPVSIGVGVRYWADSTDGGPHGFGARAIITFLVPKK